MRWDLMKVSKKWSNWSLYVKKLSLEPEQPILLLFKNFPHFTYFGQRLVLYVVSVFIHDFPILDGNDVNFVMHYGISSLYNFS